MPFYRVYDDNDSLVVSSEVSLVGASSSLTTVLVINTTKNYFFTFACALCEFLCKSLKFVPKWSLSYLQPILVAVCVSLGTVRVKLITDFYTWAIVILIK